MYYSINSLNYRSGSGPLFFETKRYWKLKAVVIIHADISVEDDLN